MIVDLRPKSRGFFLQTKLRGGVENAANAILRQISKRRLASSRSRERNICAERFRQSGGIDTDLRNIPVRFRSREKFAVAFVDENVEHRFVEHRIRRVSMQFPIPVDEIDLDAAT